MQRPAIVVLGTRCLLASGLRRLAGSLGLDERSEQGL